MGVGVNTSETFDNSNINEDLSQVAYSISPTETPFLTAIKKGTTDNTLFEWPVYELAAVDISNVVVEGEAAPPVDAATLAGRAQNYTQISDKVISVSDTAQAIDDAGKLQKMAKQKAIKMKELKRDMEAMLLANKAAATGSSGVARVTAGAVAWLKTNTSTNGGTDPTTSGGGFNGYPNAAAGAGTSRALTEALADVVMEECYTEGGEPSMVLIHPRLKRVISDNFTGGATMYRDKSDKTATASIDFWESDYGDIKVVMDRFLPTIANAIPTSSTNAGLLALFIDPAYWEMKSLYGIRSKKLAPTGHAEQELIHTEFGLACHNEKSSGIVRDLTAASS